MTEILNWLTANWVVASIAGVIIYDVVVRAYPTSKNWSIWAIIGQLFDILIANKKLGGGLFVAVEKPVIADEKARTGSIEADAPNLEKSEN